MQEFELILHSRTELFSIDSTFRKMQKIEVILYHFIFCINQEFVIRKSSVHQCTYLKVLCHRYYSGIIIPARFILHLEYTSHVVAMEMGNQRIVQLLILSRCHGFDIIHYPFAGSTAGIGFGWYVSGVAGFVFSRIYQHRGAVGKNEIGTFSTACIDVVNIHISFLPCRQCLSHFLRERGYREKT